MFINLFPPINNLLTPLNNLFSGTLNAVFGRGVEGHTMTLDDPSLAASCARSGEPIRVPDVYVEGRGRYVIVI